MPELSETVAAVTVSQPVDGTADPYKGLHGLTGYGKGCRCDICRAAKAATNRASRERRKAGQPAGPLHVVAALPDVLSTAWALAGGDPARLRVQRDGSIIVANGPRTGPGQVGR